MDNEIFFVKYLLFSYAYDKLTNWQKFILYLHTYCGYNGNEIAKMVHISRQRVYGILNECYKKIKRSIKEFVK